MKNKWKRLFSLLLAAALLVGICPVAGAAEEHAQTRDLRFAETDTVAGNMLDGSVIDETESEVQSEYDDNEIVRVSIVLDKEPAVAVYGAENVAENGAVAAYRNRLESEQGGIEQQIEHATGESLDVVWNLTLAANLISANVRYGQIKEIEKVRGVKSVVIETRYEPMVLNQSMATDPNMSTSSSQIGSQAAWAAGYTGAGTKIAVIDTGIDLDHQSFSESGYLYAMEELAEDENQTLAEYEAAKGILTKNDVASILGQLNIGANAGMDAQKLYQSAKIPFAYNYVDSNFTVDHDSDEQGEHGSHVAGISAANRYLETADGTFENALDTVKVQGVAPDAQLIVMKVFGEGGGAYDSDYMAAIEDAVVLGCDAINLSLGSSNSGFSRSAEYESVLERLTQSGAVVCISSGNSGAWAENANNGGYLYSDDVSFQTGGSPGTYSNALTVASVDNTGYTGNYFSVNGKIVFFQESQYSNRSLLTLAGDHEYVFLDGYGTEADYASAPVAGKIVFVSRGEINFSAKANEAIKAGAIATIVYNNEPGTINMDLSDYTGTAPCVSITQADGAAIRELSEQAAGYCAGTMHIASDVYTQPGTSDTYTMSSFSSWGVPGSLELKPEITAPGGNIYSVNGAEAGGKGYENMSGTSMAAPQVSGMAALLAQYIRENGLDAKISARKLASSLLMSTAEPVINAENGLPYSVLQQGTGLANIGNALNAKSYIIVKDNLSKTAADGKVKAEFGDDPQKTGAYDFSFGIYNLNGEQQQYTLSAELFTQAIRTADGTDYMDTLTAALDADVTYEVNGQSFTPTSKIDCDVNRDGTTNRADAQLIIDYTLGKEQLDEEQKQIADLDGSGSVSTYDAHLLLKGLQITTVDVPIGSVTNVTVHIRLTDAAKAALNVAYPNGAYVEGYVHVDTADTFDGEIYPAHSIPMLGFYGRWSDASMFDGPTWLEHAYGDNDATYLGNVNNDYFAMRFADDSTSYFFTGNPYLIEQSFPEARLAINSKTLLQYAKVSLIRNAAAVGYYVKNENTGKVTRLNISAQQAYSAFYYAKQKAWQYTDAKLNLGLKPSAAGLREGDRFTMGVFAIPEYYEQNGELTQEQITALLESDTLGEGAFLRHTLVVDNTAPELISAQKDEETGALTVTVKDNNYVAAVFANKANAAKDSLGYGIPEQSVASETCSYTFELSADAGEIITITVGDYARNEKTYKIYYGGTPEDHSGKLYGFTASDIGVSSGKRWVEIEPAILKWLGSKDHVGMTDLQAFDKEVYAAEYAGKYVFFATEDAIYAARHGSWDEAQKICSLGKYLGAKEIVLDMAFNRQNQTMYAITGVYKTSSLKKDLANTSSALYEINLVTGEMKKIAEITTTKGSAAVKLLRTLAIDDDGNFYAVNNANSSTYAYLYKWTLSDIKDGKISNLKPVGTKSMNGGYAMKPESFSSMTYDHDSGKLYLSVGVRLKNSADSSNKLWVVDPAKGTADKPVKVPTSTNGTLQANVVALYAVSESDAFTLPSDAEVTDIVLDQKQLQMPVGGSVTLHADVLSWLASDKSIIWSSDNTAIASVDASGVVTGMAAGEAVITAQSRANPSVTATCTVAVADTPVIHANALIHQNDGTAVWASFQSDAPENWTALGESKQYYAGSLYDGMIMVHDGSAGYGVDPDTFESTFYTRMSDSFIWSDATESPADGVEALAGSFGIAYQGRLLTMMDLPNGKASYLDTKEWNFFDGEAMAAIAFGGRGTHQYERWNPSTEEDETVTTPINNFYVLTENGNLYSLGLYIYDDFGDLIPSWTTPKKLGSTGLDLSGVPGVVEGSYASMIYDADSDYLLLALTAEGDAAHLYEFSPEKLTPADLGTFGAQAGPVVALYQYDRPTDLTLRLKQNRVYLYADETAKVDVAVLNADNEALYWVSSNESVATVKDGVITAVSDGTATITVTTEAVNTVGEHVSAEVTVTVQALSTADVSLSAQLNSGDGASWVTLDLSDGIAVTEVKNGATALKNGGGYAAGYLYGSTADLDRERNGYIYQVDPETFKESRGSGVSPSYALRSLTDAPATKLTYTADGETQTFDAFGMPLFLAESGGLYFINDYVKGTLFGWNFAAICPDACAITYIGSYTENVGGEGYDAGTQSHRYLVLNTDGRLTLVQLTPQYYEENGESGVGYSLKYVDYGNTDHRFTDGSAVAMQYVENTSAAGLVITDAASGGVYYVDMTGSAITFSKIGTLEAGTTAALLYNTPADADADKNLFAVQSIPQHEIGGMSEAIRAEAVDAAKTPEITQKKSRPVSGSLNSVQPVNTQSVNTQEAASASTKISASVSQRNTVTVSILAENATNGFAALTYDSNVLKLVSVSAGSQTVNGYAEDGTGKLAFAYAAADAFSDQAAVVTFSYDASSCPSSTKLTLTVQEQNETAAVTEMGASVKLRESTVTIPAPSTGDGSSRADREMPFIDVTKNDWFYDSVKGAWQNYLIDGATANTYNPTGTLTVAEAIKLAGALHQLDKDGKVTLKNGKVNWYDSYVEYGIANGILDKAYAGYTNAQMNAPATRREFVHIFYGAMDSYKAINNVADNAIPDVKTGDKCADEIYAFYRAGILTGSDKYGSFKPDSTIVRSEVAAILVRMYDASMRGHFELK